jgi:hypothetical protein
VIKSRILLAMLFSLTALAPAGAGDRTDTVVTFKPGKTTFRYDGVIKGYQYPTFLIDARIGQTLKVTFKRTSTCQFVIAGPPKDAVFFDGYAKKDALSELIMISGRYRVTVYQMRTFARRGRKCWYGINIDLKN